MNEIHKTQIYNLDILKYDILDISPVCLLNNYICFHNIKIIRKDQTELIEEVLVDGMTIAKYMKHNMIDIPFHFAQYTCNGDRN